MRRDPVRPERHVVAVALARAERDDRRRESRRDEVLRGQQLQLHRPHRRLLGPRGRGERRPSRGIAVEGQADSAAPASGPRPRGRRWPSTSVGGKLRGVAVVDRGGAGPETDVRPRRVAEPRRRDAVAGAAAAAARPHVARPVDASIAGRRPGDPDVRGDPEPADRRPGLRVRPHRGLQERVVPHDDVGPGDLLVERQGVVAARAGGAEHVVLDRHRGRRPAAVVLGQEQREDVAAEEAAAPDRDAQARADLEALDVDVGPAAAEVVEAHPVDEDVVRSGPGRPGGDLRVHVAGGADRAAEDADERRGVDEERARPDGAEREVMGAPVGRPAVERHPLEGDLAAGQGEVADGHPRAGGRPEDHRAGERGAPRRDPLVGIRARAHAHDLAGAGDVVGAVEARAGARRGASSAVRASRRDVQRRSGRRRRRRRQGNRTRGREPDQSSAAHRATLHGRGRRRPAPGTRHTWRRRYRAAPCCAASHASKPVGATRAPSPGVSSPPATSVPK